MINDQSAIEHHFESAEQQQDAARLGMWIFLATEVLFFSALFMAYTFVRWSDPGTVHAASRHLELVAGTLNTAVLLTSSFLMAAGVHFAELGQRRIASGFIAITAVMGFVFLGVKGTEYYNVYHENHFPGPQFRFEQAAHGPQAVHGVKPVALQLKEPTGTESMRPGVSRTAELFFWLYFVMTGLHGLHVLIGSVLLGVIAWMLRRPRGVSNNTVHNAGLYWHFVDMVWVFLFPLLYLAGFW